MEQESVEDLILNGDVPTPIKHGDIGRSGAKLLGMLSETDNSGIEYKSFTEESATEEEYATPLEVNGLSDETKAPFKSEIVLPRISSTESARGALNDANNVYSNETNPRSKKDRKHRKRSRTSSKEKKNRKNTKETKRARSRSKSKNKTYKKRKKRKKRKKNKKKRNRSKSRLTGAEVRLRMDPYALLCATKWEELGNTAPLAEEVVEFSISYPAGPMGITFDWRNGLVVMAVQNKQTANAEKNLPQDDKVSTDLLGSRLCSVNGTSTLNLNFREIVDMMRSLAESERTLTFQSWRALKKSKPGASSQPAVRFPTITPNSTKMDLRAKSAASLPRHNLNEEDFNRPASASNAMGENSDPQKAPTMKMTDAFQHSVSSLEDSKTSGEKSTAQMKIINDRADAFIDEIFEKKKTEDSNIRASQDSSLKTWVVRNNSSRQMV